MKNSFGNAIQLTLFGESHGQEIGCVLDGLAPGMHISEERIAHFLSLRRPVGKISTPRREPDPFRIVSGVCRGRSTGTPLCILIPNMTQRSADYETETKLRPGHADFTAQMKYHGFQDTRGGGHFSGRITAPLVAAGAILSAALEEKGIRIGTHILSCAGISDRLFGKTEEDLDLLSQSVFPVLDPVKAERMQEAILRAAEDGDSVGGVLETCLLGMPAGVGEPWFDSLESMLSHALFSIPAVKGVEFGAGFAISSMRGSEANDPISVTEEGKIETVTNRNGGINGGISNGMPLIFRCAVKPTPTISKKQNTVDLQSGKGCVHAFAGRHDPCIVHRARIVADAMTALVLADLLTERFGTDFLSSENGK